jgi:hypothetical protein
MKLESRFELWKDPLYLVPFAQTLIATETFLGVSEALQVRG